MRELLGVSRKLRPNTGEKFTCFESNWFHLALGNQAWKFKERETERGKAFVRAPFWGER